MAKNILSIQSWVTYGHVGNASAIFPLQRLGFEVWGIHTVQFSNHTGYGTFRGEIFSPSLVQQLLTGVEELGKLPFCDAILSGYLGDASLGETILSTVKKIKTLRKTALYCCDPVMGDVGRGFFVRPGIPDFFKEQALSVADIVTPNQFELEYLTGINIQTRQDAVIAAQQILKKGPRCVLVTSLQEQGANENTIAMLAVSNSAAYLVQTPRLPINVNGAGDATAALFLGYFLQDENLETALSKTASAIFAILEETHRLQEREIQIITSQDRWMNPKTRFQAEQIL